MLLARPLRSSRVGIVLSIVVLLTIILLARFHGQYHLEQTWWRTHQDDDEQVVTTQSTPGTEVLRVVESAARHLIDFPLSPPYRDSFGELGERAQTLRDSIAVLEVYPDSDEKTSTAQVIERAAQSLFPYLRSSPQNPESKTPLSDLRSSFVPGSKGIVIPTGHGTLRFACHLIGSLKEVLRTELPIEIAYAGDDDLPPSDRDWLRSEFTDIQFLDVLSVFDDATLKLAKNGGWAIKAFASLASSFEHVILADADAVFLQPPETLFSQAAYTSTGVLLFHDRLLWQHGFAERHEWWRAQIRHPSATMDKSLVWTEEYAEEGDSGVVVVDKSRLDVLVGLLHVCWQNSAEVRDEVTYKITYGDKESWWLGFELAGATYAFERHYGSMMGWLEDGDGKGEGDEKKEGEGEGVEEGPKVCSFVIAHLDQDGGLLWYNGGLLKNKLVDPQEFEVPTHWMVDGTWKKGARKERMSCMVGTEALELSLRERETISRAISTAQRIDGDLEQVLDTHESG